MVQSRSILLGEDSKSSSIEPELPLIGINFHKLRMEGEIIMKAAKSAQRVFKLNRNADKSLMKHLKIQK
jgi:hypothetical protein